MLNCSAVKKGTITKRLPSPSSFLFLATEGKKEEGDGTTIAFFILC
jgi:hypothetical protein